MLDTEKSGVEIERKEKNEIAQELTLTDRLAIERTVFSADRTMLSGVRTSISFIGFGFTIFNVLRYVQQNAPIKQFMRPQTPRNIGAFMLVAGIVPLFFMISQYSRTLKRLGRKENIFSNPNFLMAGVIFLLGIILMLAVIGNVLLL